MSSCFVAIDFETANPYSDSACAIGLVRVEDQKIVESRYSLIRPPYQWFRFTDIHGITWQDVRNAPNFQEVWTDLKPLLKGAKFLAAHNASFDRRVLYACCERYKMAVPKKKFVCTVQMARKQLGIYPTNLASVCQNLQIPLKHHHAESDALACAKIALKTLEQGEALYLKPKPSVSVSV